MGLLSAITNTFGVERDKPNYDIRGAHATLAKHWQEGVLGTRVFFRTMTEPATLSIDSVTEKDAGQYRCRIDYTKSPTRNFRSILSIIVPPRKPTIIDEKGKEVPSVAGPYEEGGKPEPAIKWWREGKLIESTQMDSGFPYVRSNQLVVRKLHRSDQHAAFTCQASNNNISQPVSATTSIEIHFRPLSAEILINHTPSHPLSADRKYEIPCQTFGSRPPAKITWQLDGKDLKSPHYNFTEHVNAPILKLSMGRGMNPNDIEEGDDVYFYCKIDAHPRPYKVIWKHNGHQYALVWPNLTKIQRGYIKFRRYGNPEVNRHQAGNYSCFASNAESDGESNTIELKVMYTPICRSEQKKIYGVARRETAKVLCEVESYPPPDTFEWSFNNSAETINVPDSRYMPGEHNFSSSLTYTPVTELDYGTVSLF
ncbi:unnamed protein product [Brassicogethes aeneus]|uniref:Ig-like domain-containing protein n=1 Tax=Brassicogethes aeneus TaxID=1431903 RepID=A0A9P0AYE0_BRAAE|nr:unnamed protein product [Brassicogethes aeneus]